LNFRLAKEAESADSEDIGYIEKYLEIIKKQVSSFLKLFPAITAFV
jgi:hypothetical protein